MNDNICKKHLIFLGPPGSGKGTQAELFEKDANFKHFSTGDILRESIRKNNVLGKKIKDILECGDLVSDSIMKEIIREKFKEIDKNEKFVLDGYPRTLRQGKDLDAISNETSIKIDRVIYINVADDVIIYRISSRRICPKCGTVYNTLTLKPEKEGLCNKCGTALIQRKDDRKEAIIHRLEVYRESTEPLISYYKKRNLLTEVDGNDKIKTIFNFLIEKEILCR
jgi:adenylate kinase